MKHESCPLFAPKDEFYLWQMGPSFGVLSLSWFLIQCVNSSLSRLDTKESCFSSMETIVNTTVTVNCKTASR